MNNNEAIESFFLDISEYQEYKNIEYLCFNIRKATLDYLSLKRETSIDPFMKPLHNRIKKQLEKGAVNIDELLSFMIVNDTHSWCFYFVLTRFKRKEGVSEDEYYCAVGSAKDVTSLIEIDYDKIAMLVLGFSMDYFSKNTIDIKNIVVGEQFSYKTNQYGLSKINGAIFKKDGLIYDKKYYLYSWLTNTSVLEYFDEMPAFARIISEQVNSGDILFRLDERLSVPENQMITYSTLNSEKFRGPQFNFNNSVFKARKTIIVHIDENSMNKLLMVIKQCDDEISGKPF